MGDLAGQFLGLPLPWLASFQRLFRCREQAALMPAKGNEWNGDFGPIRHRLLRAITSKCDLNHSEFLRDLRSSKCRGSHLSADCTSKSVHRIKQEIDRLKDELADALKSAIYLGMSTEQAKAYDERRNRITRLMQELQALTRAQ